MTYPRSLKATLLLIIVFIVTVQGIQICYVSTFLNDQWDKGVLTVKAAYSRIKFLSPAGSNVQTYISTQIKTTSV